MKRGARSLRPLDVTRLGQAASRPGIDPRTWCMLGRIEEIGYDQGLVVAVHVVEGALAGEDVTCELGTALATEGGLGTCAVAVGDMAVIVVPNGDGNNMGIVIAFVHEPEVPPPETVNGRAIDAELLSSTHVLADADRALELELKSVRLVADQTQIGPTPDPTQAFVRGTAFMQSLSTYLSAQLTFATALSTAIAAAAAVPTEPGLAGLSTAMTPWVESMTALKAHLIEGDALSRHIKGE